MSAFVSQFTFLRREWPEVFEAAARGEMAVHRDPRTACFYARRALELAVAWAFKNDAALTIPYDDKISALIHDPNFKRIAGDAVFAKARVVITLGNRAVHGARAIPVDDALVSVRELFHVAYWLARTYARAEKPAAALTFDPAALPKPGPSPKQTAAELQKVEAELRDRDEQLSAAAATRAALDDELQKLRAEIAAVREAAAARPDAHDYNETETRDYFIDLLLKEAGWGLAEDRDREFEVDGMPNNKGKGYVDYVLWGDDGKPLGLVEAKRTRRDPRVGQHQANLYADCLEKRFGQRPVIFYSNGYEHWIWDDANYPPRAVQGFYKKDELELLIRRRESRRPLAASDIDKTIVERFYQERAIRRIAESFETDRSRKALLVMATGAGKTRTVIALADLLMRANWAKRVLFLADRVALVNQAVNAFKRHLPSAPAVNLVTERGTQGRVYVSTYPTMMGLIDERSGTERRFGPGHFDLIVIDEAHRSVFHKYAAIFDYFDALLVGLTATPKDELDRNTYKLFDLENGVPTDAYQLDDAVRDGFLVPARSVSVPLKFQRDGIKYDELSEDDKDQWDELDWVDWDAAGLVPREVDPAAVNKWLFNKDTVDKVLEHLMTRGQKVAGGDRLGKTIIFAKNQDHAQFIADRFDANYPHLRGHFARVITFKTEYAQDLIDHFSMRDHDPHVAVSVDMLDTGIDVPEILNLVFFKLVRSKTKFWQMLGRGTRLCPDLFGPGVHKAEFFVFDFCGNLEFFKQDLPKTDGASPASLGRRLFTTRLELLNVLDRETGAGAASAATVREAAAVYGDPRTDAELRTVVAGELHREVDAMNLDNFVVRAHRRVVERYKRPEAWLALSREATRELETEVAGLPAELDPENEDAKRFDLLMLRIQLARLGARAGFEQMREEVRSMAGALEEKAAIPMVRAELDLIHEVQSDEWWQDVTIVMLERVRRRLRGLIQFIDVRQRRPIFTDFEDEIGPEQLVGIAGLSAPGAGEDFERFRRKAQAYLREHQEDRAIQKLRTNQPLTSQDLHDLEAILAAAGGGAYLQRASDESRGLGLFVRSLVGLDREAAKAVLTEFLAGKSLAANQIEFVNLIVDHLTEHGSMEPARLYESPFIDLAPHGPEGLFAGRDVDELIAILERVRRNAISAS